MYRVFQTVSIVSLSSLSLSPFLFSFLEKISSTRKVTVQCSKKIIVDLFSFFPITSLSQEA